MSLLDAVSGALTAGTEAAGAQQQGELQGSQLLRAIMMQQAQLAKEQAETSLTRERTVGQQRQNTVPLLGTPEYNTAMAGKSAAEAAATLPYDIQKLIASGQISLQTGLALGRQRGQIEGGLQSQREQFEQGQQNRQQTFQAGQQEKQQTFQAGQQQSRLQGEYQNQVGLQGVKEGGEIVPRVMRKITGNPLPTAGQPAPSAPIHDLSTQRADWDAAAAHARSIGKDPDTELGPRP